MSDWDGSHVRICEQSKNNTRYIEMAHISGYIVTGFNLKMYCKKFEMGIDSPHYKCVLSFGTGMKKFCMTAMYDIHKANEIYIDRVENNDLCVIDGKLRNYDKGTVKLVKTAICVIKELFPQVTKLTLNDASQIYCEDESKMFKLSMSYDYILKYNETWYQKNFNAILPGFISKQYDSNNRVQITAEPDSMMDAYVTSLRVLDEEREDYSFLSNRFTQFEEYKEDYESSTTPRKFINTLRKNLDDTFCHIVGKWLNQYMVLLQIKLSPGHWYILSSMIEPVPNFNIVPMNNADAKRILDGGGNIHRNITRKKRRGPTPSRQKHVLKIIADSAFTDNFVGYYNEYD